MKIICSLLVLFLLISNNSYCGWFIQNSNVTVNLNSVTFNHGNENSAWVCGDNGVILHTTNGGTTWILQNSGTTKNLHAIVFMEIVSGPVFACGDNGTILRTTDSGANWSAISTPTNQTLHDISDFNFVACGDSGIILKSTNSGLNWVVVSSPVQKNLYAAATTFSYYIVGEDGTILRGLNQGMTWSTLTSGITNDFFGVPLFGSLDIVVGSGGAILRSTNLGANWFLQNSMTGQNINSVEYSVNNTSRIYCAGNNGLILKTTNSGSQWYFQNSGTSQNLNSVFFYLDDNTGYAVGNNGVILKTTDGGGPLTAVAESTDLQKEFDLEQNFPNPFNPVTVIRYIVSSNVKGQTSDVVLRVSNLIGEEVAMLVNQKQSAGKYSIEFNGNNLSSGIYFYSLEIDGKIFGTKRMVILK